MQRLPDLVSSDVQMPGMSAVDALELVWRRVPSLPSVLMAAVSDSNLRIRAGKLKVTCILCEPFDVEGLRAAVISLPSHPE